MKPWVFTCRALRKIPYSLLSKTLQTFLKDPIVAEKALAKGTEKWQQLAQDLQVKALSDLLQDHTWQKARDILQTYVGKDGDRLEVETRQPALRAINSVESGENITESLSVITELKINFGSKKNYQTKL